MKISNMTLYELEECRKYCNFTDDERKIFDLLAKGKSVQQIANDIALSGRSVARRIKNIKIKVGKIKNFSDTL